MQAFAGNYVLNDSEEKQAFVARCEDLKPYNLVKFNDRNEMWADLKKQMRQQKHGAWSFDDADDSFYPENKRLFQEMWANVGPEFCSRNSFEYVDYDQVTRQLGS